MLLASVVHAHSAIASDPRVEEANALLSERSGFGRAADLYRSFLEDHSDPAVRIRLARVLSWDERYGESVAEYDRLLDEPAAPDETRVERAEVLSWAGRYEEALAAFGTILAAEPENARAARGLSRVYKWSGRASDADRAYRRALELEDDRDAEREWAALRADFHPTSSAEFELYADNDGFRRHSASVHASFFPDLDTRATARLGYLRVEYDPESPAPEIADLPGDDEAIELAIMGHRRFDEQVEGEMELGARVWRHAAASPLVYARLQYTSQHIGVLGFEIDHRDALDRTDSLTAVEEGIRDTSLRATLWKGLGGRWEAFGDVETGFLTGGNTRTRTGASISHQPLQDREVWLHLSASYLGYTGSSALYYDPRFDVSLLASITARTKLPAGISIDVSAGGGWGFARQSGVDGSGPAYHVAGSLSWWRGPWRIALRGERAQSRRGSAYVAHRGTANVMLDF